MLLVQAFKKWLDENRHRLLEIGTIANIHEYQNDADETVSVLVDHDTETYIAQIHARNDGLFDIEVIDVDDPDNMAFYIYSRCEGNHFERLMENYLDFISGR